MINSSEDILSQIIEACTHGVDLFNYYNNELSKVDLLTQDILHEIELSTFNVVKGYHLAKKLKEVRLQRRIIKNECELLQPLIDFLNGTKANADKLQKSLLKREFSQSKRKYSPRIMEITNSNNSINA